mmetsp:Transcript_16417/g.49415  ORF Transcript_16417/g.49415 Transcript_16417/m.49415 type:complete len:211 (-) Transcript_16417:930-1562(-)
MGQVGPRRHQPRVEHRLQAGHQQPEEEGRGPGRRQGGGEGRTPPGPRHRPPRAGRLRRGRQVADGVGDADADHGAPGGEAAHRGRSSPHDGGAPADRLGVLRPRPDRAVSRDPARPQARGQRPHLRRGGASQPRLRYLASRQRHRDLLDAVPHAPGSPANRHRGGQKTPGQRLEPDEREEDVGPLCEVSDRRHQARDRRDLQDSRAEMER